VQVQADVTKGVEVQKMLQVATSKFDRLDILCNNAPIDGVMAPTAAYTRADFVLNDGGYPCV